MAKDKELPSNEAAQDDAAKAESEKALDVLIPELVEPESAQADPGQGGAQNTTLDAVTNLAGLLGMASLGLQFSGFPLTAKVWNGETNRAIAEKTIPVLAKYSWGNRIIDFLNGGGDAEILALIMALVPVGMATVTAFNADLAAKQPKPDSENQPVSENVNAN